MRITCITKRCTGSLHIEWASCVAATQNLYVRAQEWIDPGSRPDSFTFPAY